MRAFIVLGLGFGDEGKGVTTDYLASTLPNPIVVRFSGGQQAGHTVMYVDKKHIHSSFGSGTLRGVPSYFTEHTTFYLPNMYREWKVLMQKGIHPNLFLHPLSKMTTHLDVAFNRVREKNLGHGSCGLGVGATMKRHEDGYQLYAADLLHTKMLKQKIGMHFNYYRSFFPEQELRDEFAHEAGKLQKDFHSIIESEIWEQMFAISSYGHLEDFESLIFEGSQGILLDKDHGIFPNVTYANTTSKNAIEVCNKLKITGRSFYYVTRCYQTRHGAGWMSNEQNIELLNTEEEINIPNEWQKNFRIGEFDYDLVNQAMAFDYLYSGERAGIRNLVITCLDQRPDWKLEYDQIKFVMDGVFLNDSPRAGNMVPYSSQTQLSERVVAEE